MDGGVNINRAHQTPTVQERLNKAVLRRLEELGLPASLLDLGDFRDQLFLHRWVMFVRDGDKMATVHLVQPSEPGKIFPDLNARIRS
jgi:hypothetical protein